MLAKGVASRLDFAMGSPATLILETGDRFVGRAFGHLESSTSGEVVFNTAATGYQEVLTDPSYRGQIVVFTSPEIGVTGMTEPAESDRAHVRGLVVRRYSRCYSNWQASESLDSFLKRQRVVGIEGVDTRAITQKVRSRGCLKGKIFVGSLGPEGEEKIPTELSLGPDIAEVDLTSQVATKDPYLFSEGFRGEIMILDYGVKRSILREIADRGWTVRVLPGRSRLSKRDISQAKGILISNGPGDPRAVENGASMIRELIGERPIFGICLGCQLLGLSLDLPIEKLTFGHHGSNHPVLDLRTRGIAVTAQNHNYTVPRDAIESRSEMAITHINLNDQTVEGFELPSRGITAIQYHPEAGPGPQESRILFDRWLESL